MKLVVPHFGEVGFGFVVKVHPSGQYLEVKILAFSASLFLCNHQASSWTKKISS